MKHSIFRLFLVLSTAIAGLLPASGYVNNGVVSTATPPEIDDVIFVNNGLFQFRSLVPFETQNTLYYTNSGQIQSFGSGGNTPNSGVRFEHISGDSGLRTPAAVIQNSQGALISGTPFIILNATNVLNQGTLQVTSDGLIRIKGQEVDAHRGKFDLGSSSGAGLLYQIHGGTGFVDVDGAKLYNVVGGQAIAQTPSYVVSPNGKIGMTLVRPLSYVYRQSFGDAADPTNRFVQAVFLVSGGSNIDTKVRFADSQQLNNDFKTPYIQFSGLETNIVTGQAETKYITFGDFLASDTNSSVNGNFALYLGKSPGGALSNAIVTTNTFVKYSSPKFASKAIYQINAGDTNAVAAAAPFGADNYFTNGNMLSVGTLIVTNGVLSAAPAAVYKSYRFVTGKGNSFTYDFTNLLALAQFTVRLHFADLKNSFPGERQFNVGINGTQVLTNFDIIGTAGTTNLAVVQEFNAKPDKNGTIEVVFTTADKGDACVNGIEVISQEGIPFPSSKTNAYYSALKAGIDSSPQPAANAGTTSSTNYAGRLEIVGTHVNLENARIRGQGVVNIKAEHLDSTGLLIDVPFLNYNLGIANSDLLLKNLSPASISRFASGTIQAWSAIWTNGFDNVVTDAAGVATTTHYETAYHVLFVQSDLNTANSVSLENLTATGINTTIADEVNVGGAFQLNSEGLTVNGMLSLGNGKVSDWAVTNVPSLKYLTNNGTINITGQGTFGGDRELPYEVLENSGTINSIGMSIKARNLDNYGILKSTYFGASGPMSIQATKIRLDGPNSQVVASGADMFIQSVDLKMRNARVSTGRGLLLDISNSLTDAGATALTRISADHGFKMIALPPIANLLGTEFTVSVPKDFVGEVVWPAVNLGLDRRGYSNNAAIARLVLNLQPSSLLTFSGTAAGKALYVDYLSLAPDVAQAIDSFVQIADDFVVYFADSNIPIDQLDGALGGKLRWVGGFGGPFSGVNVALPGGKLVRVNRNVFNSTTIDSDSDGIANAFDQNPFGGVNVTTKVLNLPPLTIELSWLGAPFTTYMVEVSNSLLAPQWRPVSTVGNADGTAVPLQVLDPVLPGKAAQYYRVTYEP